MLEKAMAVVKKVAVAAAVANFWRKVTPRQKNEHRLAGPDVAFEVANLDEVVHVEEALDLRQQQLHLTLHDGHLILARRPDCAKAGQRGRVGVSSMRGMDLTC